MNPSASVEGMLQALHASDDRLQVALRDLVTTYYQFVHAPRQYAAKVTNKLVLRVARDGEGRIRRLFWARRCRALKQVGLELRHHWD